jgi:hypothetical protein
MRLCQNKDVQMIPFSFIWKRVSDEWLLSRTATLLFGMSACVVVGLTAVFIVDKIPVNEPGIAINIFWGTVGVFGAFSIFFIWGGMLSYWTRCDSSTRVVRRLRFFLLVIGIWYGAVLYYLLVYIRDARVNNRSGIPGAVQ